MVFLILILIFVGQYTILTSPVFLTFICPLLGCCRWSTDMMSTLSVWSKQAYDLLPEIRGMQNRTDWDTSLERSQWDTKEVSRDCRWKIRDQWWGTRNVDQLHVCWALATNVRKVKGVSVALYRWEGSFQESEMRILKSVSYCTIPRICEDIRWGATLKGEYRVLLLSVIV